MTYPGGAVTARLGVLKAMFGNLSFRWVRPTGTTPSGRRKQYRGKQRSNAAAGQPVWVRFTNGELYQVRITSTLTEFIDHLIAKTDEGRIVNVWTSRGSMKGPEIDENGPLLPG